MATSGSNTNGFRSGYQVKITWARNSVNVSANTSNVTVSAQLVSTGSAYTIVSSATKNGSITIDGTTYSFTFSAALSGGQTKTVFSKTVDIPHSSDGSKTFSMSTNLGIAVTLGGTYYGNVSVSASGVLDNIPRTSTFTLSHNSIDAGQTITANISRASSSFTHKVYYTFGKTSVTISTNAATSASYAIPLGHLAEIPTSTSGTATIKVDTYNGSTFIGSNSRTFTILAPASVKPTISSITSSVVDAGAPTNFGYVQNKSKASLVINGASGIYGSSISSYSITGGGFSASSSSYTTGVLSSSGSITFTATVRDSRGRTSDAKTVTINVQPYSKPKISTFKVERVLSTGAASEEGTIAKITQSHSITAIGSLNSSTVQVRSRETGGTWSNYTNMTGSTISLNNNYSTEKTYEFELKISDKLDISTSTIYMSAAFVTIDFKAGGKGIAIGKISEHDNLFDVGTTARFRQFIEMTSPGGSRTEAIIKTYEGDVNGMGISIQGGGKTVIGAGESAVNFITNDGSYGAESMFATADNDVYLISNMQAGYSARKGIRISNTGELSFPYGGRILIPDGESIRFAGGGYIQLPNNPSSWIQGATNGALRGAKQTSGSYHPIISVPTVNNHKISLGGLGDEFGFHLYDANRTVNGIDKYFRFNLVDKTVHTDCRTHINEWLYLTGTYGVYFSTYQGGLFMQDSTWLRSYNNKSFYTANTVRCGTSEQRYLRPEGANNMDIAVNGGSMYFAVAASSGCALYLNRNWSGTSGTEPSFYNTKGNGWGYIGNSGVSFYRVYGAGGSVSDRKVKYEITKADVEEQYENLKNIGIYNYRTVSTINKDINEIAADYLKDRIEFYSNQEERILTTESIVVDEIIYDALDSTLSQEEISKIRIEEIVNKNKRIGEVKRQDLSLGCMVDEMPLETTFYDNEGGDGKAVDMYSYTTMIAGATKHLIDKVEILEKENEYLRNKLDRMEEILNGIISER